MQEAGGQQAGGHQAEGHQAEGHQAEGHQAEGRTPFRRRRLVRPGLWALGLLALALSSTTAVGGRTLNWELLKPGYELDADELRDSLGRSLVVSEASGRSQLRLPPLTATETRLESPRSLLLSNNPEILDWNTLPRRNGVLVRGRLESGDFRVLASHSNQTSLGYDLFLRLRPASDEPATVEVGKHCAATANLIPGTQRLDCAVGASLLAAYLAPRPAQDDLWTTRSFVKTLRQDDVVNLPLVYNFRGLACTLTEASTSAPLQASVVAIPHGGTPDEQLPVLKRQGSQNRGVFASPDLGVNATIAYQDGQCRRYVFGQAERTLAKGVLDKGNWMQGQDSTLPDHVEVGPNKGDFGGFTRLHVTAEDAGSSGFKGVMLVLAAGGPKAAVLAPGMQSSSVLEKWHGRVVARLRPQESWDYTFTLPPNSWAPVYLISVPLRTSW